MRVIRPGLEPVTAASRTGLAFYTAPLQHPTKQIFISEILWRRESVTASTRRISYKRPLLKTLVVQSSVFKQSNKLFTKIHPYYRHKFILSEKN